MKTLKLLYTLLVSANALLVNSQVTFKVIAVTGTPSVVINNKKYRMEVDEYPVYSTTVNIQTPAYYHYALGNEEENFSRIINSESTLNEFFNRNITVKNHPLFPKAFESFPTLKKSKLYDDTHIATILIEGNQKDIDTLHANPSSSKKYDVKITYVSPYTVKVFNNGAIKISGQSSKNYKKLSYKINGLKIEDKELFGRTGLKLRSEYNDPSFMREKTYYDMLNAIGVPTSQGKFIRLFINKKPVGLFLMTDDYSNKHFLKSVFNNGKKFLVDNAVFKVNAGGDLSYKGTSKSLFDPYSYKGDLENANNYEKIKELLVPFMKDVNNYPSTKKLNLDIEGFLRNMALEYLAYGADNFWMVQGNYFIFRNNATSMWYFIDNDFDMTYGHGSPDKCLSTTLDNYVNIKSGDHSRPLIDNLRTVSANEKYLKNAVERMLQTVFNINAAGPRIDSFAELLRDDVIWDFSLPKMSTYSGSKTKNHKLSDFERQVGSTTNKSYPYPIKTWIINRSNKVASIYNFSLPHTPSDSLGYFEPEYEDKSRNDNPKTTTIPNVTPTPTPTPTTTVKTTTTNSPTKTPDLPYSDNKCGPNVAICMEGLCCSKYGYCGSTNAYCGSGCQNGFGRCNSSPIKTVTTINTFTTKTTNPSRTTTSSIILPTSSGKCGPGVAICSNGLCCSKYGYCGTSNLHCGAGCQSEFGKCDATSNITTITTTTKKSKTTTKTTKKSKTTTKTTKKSTATNSSGKCGASYGSCPSGYCCSKYGYCGISSAYCSTGCQKDYGKCN